MSSVFIRPLPFSRALWKSDSLIVGIRREDPKRIWGRRAPLTPDAIHKLTSSLNAGAILADNLINAQIVLGIKEPPLDVYPPIPVNKLISCSPIRPKDSRTIPRFSKGLLWTLKPNQTRNIVGSLTMSY